MLHLHKNINELKNLVIKTVTVIVTFDENKEQFINELSLKHAAVAF